MYGFKKRKHPEKLNEFFHPFFKKGENELLFKIRRKYLEDNNLENKNEENSPNDLEKG